MSRPDIKSPATVVVARSVGIVGSGVSTFT